MSIHYYELTNPDAPSTSGKATQKTLAATGAMAGIVQPDYPRNLVITLTDADASVTALQITITGDLATGETEQTEVYSTVYVGSTQMNEAWAKIDSITIDSITGGAAADLIDIGWGVKFGLGNAIDAASDIIKTNMDNDDAVVSGHTISTTYDTIQFATAPNAAHDYQVWYSTD